MTVPLKKFVKDPDAINLPKGFNWTKYLAEIADDETIASSTWSLSPSDGLTVSAHSIVTGSRKTQGRFTGGTEDAEVIVTNHIVTNSGVEDDRSFIFVMKHR